MGWRGAQARIFALLVGKPGQQIKHFSEIKKLGFFSNLHVPSVCFVIEKRKNVEISKEKKKPF